MTTSIVHYSNQLLPDVEWEGIPRDEEQSVQRINSALEKLEGVLQTTEEVTPLLFGKCARLIKHHRTLKYHFSVSVTSLLISALRLIS